VSFASAWKSFAGGKVLKEEAQIAAEFLFLLQKILLLGSCFRDMASSCIRQVCFFEAFFFRKTCILFPVFSFPTSGPGSSSCFLSRFLWGLSFYLHQSSKCIYTISLPNKSLVGEIRWQAALLKVGRWQFLPSWRLPASIHQRRF